jgi:hypothetical protein
MKNTLFLASGAILTFQAAPSWSAPVNLASATSWHVDYGASQCTAATTYQKGAQPVVLGIIPSLGGDRYKILVSIPQAGPAYAQQAKGTVNFGSGPIASPTLFYGREGVPLSVRQFEVTAANLQQARSAGAMTLHSSDGADFTFALNNMSNVLDTLRNCSADLQRYWNAHGAGSARAASSRAADLRSLYTPSDLPGGTWYRSPESLSQARGSAFELLVDERGRVAGCDATSATGAPILETSFCTTMQEKARFTPARDSAGNPVRSIVTTASVDWGNFNELNTGCLWVTGSSFGVINSCGGVPTSAMPAFTPPPTMTAPPASSAPPAPMH